MKGREEAVSLREAEEKYRGFWVAAHVTERDQSGQPVKVKVLASSRDRFKLREDFAQEPHLFIFYAGEAPWEWYDACL